MDSSINYVSSVRFVALLFEQGTFSKIEASIDNEEVARSIKYNFECSFVPHPIRPEVYVSLEEIVDDLLAIWEYEAIAKWLKSLIEPPTELVQS